jgi:hypothetical protein
MRVHPWEYALLVEQAGNAKQRRLETVDVYSAQVSAVARFVLGRRDLGRIIGYMFVSSEKLVITNTIRLAPYFKRSVSSVNMMFRTLGAAIIEGTVDISMGPMKVHDLIRWMLPEICEGEVRKWCVRPNIIWKSSIEVAAAPAAVAPAAAMEAGVEVEEADWTVAPDDEWTKTI